nr:MAG TPA: angiopoietin-related protein 4-like domain protein [Caudoviricetes sp.]
MTTRNGWTLIQKRTILVEKYGCQTRYIARDTIH